MMRKVKHAEIEIVEGKNLEPGDEILFSDIRCVVTEVGETGYVYFKAVESQKEMQPRNFREWYKLLHYLEE